jgi:hypothetical protein
MAMPFDDARFVGLTRQEGRSGKTGRPIHMETGSELRALP